MYYYNDSIGIIDNLLYNRTMRTFISFLLTLIILPINIQATICIKGPGTFGVGLDIKLPLQIEKSLGRRFGLAILGGFESTLTVFTSEYDATSYGSFGRFEFRVYKDLTSKRNWGGIYVSQRYAYTRMGPSYAGREYDFLPVTDIGICFCTRLKDIERLTGNVSAMIDVNLEFGLSQYRNIVPPCYSDDDEIKTFWAYLGVRIGLGLK